MNKISREQKILKYLRTYKTLTPLEAINMFGETRLSARIYDMKKDGYKFETTRIRVPTRDGWSYVAQYRFLGR